jgi:plasmid stability protein
MGQIILHHIDDSIIEAFKRKAAANGRSLEAELCEVLNRNVPDRSALRRAMAMQVRSQLPDPTSGRQGAEIIRWYRDTNGGREPDAF